MRVVADTSSIPAKAPYWLEFCTNERMDAQAPNPNPKTKVTTAIKPEMAKATVQLRPIHAGGCLGAKARASFCMP